MQNTYNLKIFSFEYIKEFRPNNYEIGPILFRNVLYFYKMENKSAWNLPGSFLI